MLIQQVLKCEACGKVHNCEIYGEMMDCGDCKIQYKKFKDATEYDDYALIFCHLNSNDIIHEDEYGICKKCQQGESDD